MIKAIAQFLALLAATANRVHPLLGASIKALNHLITGADISASAKIGSHLKLFHPTGVVVGPNVVIGNNCLVQQSVTLGHGRTGSPIIGNDVSIGPGAVIVGGYKVGNGAIIGANSVVTCDVPPGQIWVGAPARRLRVK